MESAIPLDAGEITVFTFFGDLRSSFVLSSLLLRRYREEVKGSRYFIVVTWPGYSGLFPYANEVWTVKDTSAAAEMMKKASRFANPSDMLIEIRQQLNWVFTEVLDASELETYYNDGITQEFWDKFKHVKRTFLNIPSATFLGNEFLQELGRKPGHKVLTSPSTHIRTWQHGKLVYTKTPKQFWVDMYEHFLKNNITPVVYAGLNAHDITPEMTDRCLYIHDPDVLKLYAAMRAVGCVLDVFTGLDRWAVAARTPFVSLDERQRYFEQKENEIDGLCCPEGLPRKYIFLFPTIIEYGALDVWKVNIFEPITAKLLSFLPVLDRSAWPSMSESNEIIPYSNVSKKKMKKIGTKFIKVNKE
jgi:hypothetical protein